MTDTTENAAPQVIDPETKASLIGLCTEGVLTLLINKVHYEEDGLTFVYRVSNAAEELVANNAELCDELASVIDPDVTYQLTGEVFLEGMPDDPHELARRIKRAMAADVAWHYAMQSEHVRALGVERNNLSDRTDP